MESQKRRTINFSSDEKRVLSELVLKYQNIVENKRTDATTNSAKLKGWIRLAEEFNAISTYCHRTHVALKCCWENIKRQTKKERAVLKKKLFMTGGGKPPSPPRLNQESTVIVETILGPALEGITNKYDSDVSAEVEFNFSTEMINNIEGNAESDVISKENNENLLSVVSDPEIYDLHTEEKACSSKNILKENNENNTWTSWTPKNLKTPVSKSLRVSKHNEEEHWLKRRRPTNNCLGDELTKEKLKLVKILQDNAIKESQIRLAILEEQLKQEKLKTLKLSDSVN